MRKTRKQKIEELNRLLASGPVLTDIGGDPFTPAEASRSTRRWLESWVKPLVEDLVPELRRQQSAYRRTQ